MNNTNKKLTRLLSTTLVAACVTTLTACGVLQIISDTSPSAHFHKSADIPYGPAERNLLDFYEPVDAARDAPLVVFFYGGGWRDGKRGEYQFVASALTKAGFRVVIPDYRLFQDVVFPAFMEDAAAAVAWALNNESNSSAEDAGLYLVGHSAGAHIAALLATDHQYLETQSVPSDAIFGLVGLSGPYDFLPLESGYLQDVFPADRREKSQPINFITASMPPTLLVHGEDDDVVEPGNTARFAAAARDAGVSVTVKYYEDTGHAAVAAAMAPQLEFVADTLSDTIMFINEQEALRASRDGQKNPES